MKGTVMIVYYLRCAFNKRRNDKYAPLYSSDTDLLIDLVYWQHFGSPIDPIQHRVINPSRKNWTKRYGDVWPKPGLEVEYGGQKTLKRSDATMLNSNFMVYTLRAIELLGDYLDPAKGEFLPVVCSERNDLLIYRCLNCLDAIDEEKLEVIPGIVPPDPDTPKDFKENVDFKYYHFRADVIGETPMFIVPCHYSLYTFVTDRFVERVRKLKLKGFGFQPLWSSELGPLCDDCKNPLCPEGKDINL